MTGTVSSLTDPDPNPSPPHEPVVVYLPLSVLVSQFDLESKQDLGDQFGHFH